MTAIFGLIQADSNPSPELLGQAARALSHHAEDGCQLWQDGPAALGQALTRFWQHSADSPHPLTDPERGLTLVCDARLDNRADLARALGVDLTVSDPALVLHAYRRWGRDCPAHLLGDFVFAVWDAHSRSLFIARDPLGIRWLYYATGPRRFAFASDPAGLLELVDEAPRLDMDSLDEFLCQPTDRQVSHTLYSNLYKLPAAHALHWSDGQLSTWRYWDPAAVAPSTLRNPLDGIETLRGLLKQAVADRAITRAPLGSHLSGGLDSSAVTALAVADARQQGRPDPLAFSWSPPLEMRPLMERDERTYVQKIAEYLGIPVHYTHVPPDVDILHETADPSVLPLSSIRFEHQVMRNAHALGARVLLSGWGGDELVFSRGIGYPSGLLQRGRLLALARYLKRQFGWHPRAWVHALYSHALYPLLPNALQWQLPTNLHRSRNPEERKAAQLLSETRFSLPSEGFFQPAFYARLEKNHRVRWQWIRPGLHNSQRWYLTTLLSRIESWALWSARLGMRHAYPLLDQRLVEFTLSIPEDWVYWGGQLRQFSMQAVSDSLPSALLFGRSKEDPALFAHQKTPEHKMAVRKGRLEIFEQHAQTRPPVSDWLDFSYLHKILQEPLPTPGALIPPDQYMPRVGIWQVLNFAFLDRRATLPGDL